MIDRLKTSALFVSAAMALALAAGCSGSDDVADDTNPNGESTTGPGGKADGTAESVVITEADDGGFVDVVEGQDLVLRLSEDRSTGVSWVIVTTDRTFGHPYSDEYIEPQESAGEASGTREFIWKTTNPVLDLVGQHGLVLDSKRGDEVVASFTVTVVVKEASGSSCLGDNGYVPSCSSLPFAGELCGEDPSQGHYICGVMEGRLRDGVRQEAYACINDITQAMLEPCSTDENGELMACYFDASQRACPLAEATAACEGFVAQYGAADVDVTQEECELYLNPFQATAHEEIFNCVKELMDMGGGPAGEVLAGCAFDPKILGSLEF